MENLKPCPFCGNKSVTIERLMSGDYPKYDLFACFCEGCNSKGGESRKKNIAINAWNTRHNSHNEMISLIAKELQIDRHELGNLLQEMQAKAMIERGEIDES